MDFAMRYDRSYRPLATVLGIGPKRTTIRVADGTLHVKHGRVFAIDVPLSEIKSARVLPERPSGWGVHQFKDGWLIRGSRDGIVELTFGSRIKPKKVPGGGDWLASPVGALYISLAEPDSFIAAVRPH
ncbi:hypothetical protein [Mycobacterium branderi]|uniref:Uncharacterized protein n=2 Tax=Mycobacterium branderi TaxID=43348 RepID=A0ABM7KVG5_9MYCO|nr:hypothetical protein [Mycobacterium branderi]MCV7235237.1 hypothetical protein [Mycobacterium branderi]BBZ15007.1 hypothetical protein MBRA_52020 [Mycobacterium branderi]